MKCLIVEDEFVSRYMLKDMLPESFIVDIAVNGEEAVESFRMAHLSSHPYNLVFMDIEMPVVGGLEALLHIRELERSMSVPPALQVNIIMTTAHDDIKTITTSLNEGGAASYLVKPIDIAKLMPELDKLGFIDWGR